MKFFLFNWLFPSYFQTNVAAAVIGSAVVGGVMSSQASKSAANSQADAAKDANATQLYQYNQTREDNAPFRQTGVAANNQLAYLLGLSPTSGVKAANSLVGASLLDTSSGIPKANAALYANNPAYKAAYDAVYAQHLRTFGKGFRADSDASQLEHDLQNRLAGAMKTETQTQQNSNTNDPAYGSLTRAFGANDLANDPIYQNTFNFALDQGTQGINRQAAATGSQLSGATLKALTRFGANTAATYGNDAYNRYNTNQSNTYNRLAGISGSGQQAVNQVSSAGQNYANNVSANQIGVGNARGASAIAGANGFNNALSTGMNAYQNQQYMNQLNASSPYAGLGYSSADIQGLSGYQGIY